MNRTTDFNSWGLKMFLYGRSMRWKYSKKFYSNFKNHLASLYLKIHLQNVYHYSVLKGSLFFILLGNVWEHALYLEYVSSCFVDRCLSFCFWPSCCVFFFDLQILVTFKLCFLVYTYSRYHSEIKVYTMRSNFLTSLTLNTRPTS
jgi:hypothetical protein